MQYFSNEEQLLYDVSTNKLVDWVPLRNTTNRHLTHAFKHGHAIQVSSLNVYRRLQRRDYYKPAGLLNKYFTQASSTRTKRSHLTVLLQSIGHEKAGICGKLMD